MSNAVPFLDLPKQHLPLLGELNGAISGLVASGRFIGGPPVAAFEKSFAEFCGREHCVGVGNGTDALMLALRVLGVGHGDVVLLPAHTFIATAEAVSMLGATPRFVDIDPVTYTMSPEALDEADTTDVKAVLPVHLYGQPADMDPILATARKHGWKVLEDAAQAHGATYKDRRVGSLGDLAAFSFYPGKNLGAFGDGGAVVGSNADQLDRLRRVADHGRLSKQEHGEPGVNSRLDSIQAAVLDIKLRHLADWNAARARAATWYDDRLADVAGLTIPKVGADRTHVYHLYVVQVPDRQPFMETLYREGVGCGVHYATPLHLQPAYQELGHARGDFPAAEQVTGHCVSLPLFPDLEEAQVDRVATVVRNYLHNGLHHRFEAGS
ncbi:MAG: DegT/DnrJ/EryC1/StrS family aminotransferase [Myxococcota bacterium]